jgi:hypothetical protein
MNGTSKETQCKRGASGICGANGGFNANGCIAVFTVTSGTDDKAKCVAQGGPVTGMSDGEPQFLKVDRPPSD